MLGAVLRKESSQKTLDDDNLYFNRQNPTSSPLNLVWNHLHKTFITQDMNVVQGEVVTKAEHSGFAETEGKSTSGQSRPEEGRAVLRREGKCSCVAWKASGWRANVPPPPHSEWREGPERGTRRFSGISLYTCFLTVYP